MVARMPSNQASGHYRLVTSVIVLHADSTPMRGPDGPITIKLSCGSASRAETHRGAASRLPIDHAAQATVRRELGRRSLPLVRSGSP